MKKLLSLFFILFYTHQSDGTICYSVKQKIQFLLFPEGIRYNKKNDKCRTERINSIFAYIACLAQEVTKQKSGIPELNLEYSTLVELSGIKSNFLEDLKAISGIDK